MEHPSIRERLAVALNAALEAKGLAFRVLPVNINRMHAGSVQRSAGAATWFALLDALDGRPGGITILSWDTMRACVTRGFTLDRGPTDWEVNALD